MTETIEEIRARFRKEFPVAALVITGRAEPCEVMDKSYVMWITFAVGAGYPHDAKFKEG